MGMFNAETCKPTRLYSNHVQVQAWHARGLQHVSRCFCLQELGLLMQARDRARIRALKVYTVRKFIDKVGKKRCTGNKKLLKRTQSLA
jgi:hypothetical protein